MSGTGDACSPSPAQPSSNEDLVQRAKREISEIVREVTALARQPIERNIFFSTLLDRTVCAIAGNGAVIWDCRNLEPIALVRTGKITDASIGPFAVATHQCLIREIANHRSPAVVPSTPDAIDPNLPCNPTAFPAAVVPILDLSSVDGNGSVGEPPFVLEVFLEHEAGVATQRGYLRFVTQMGDLASEFLRADETRRSRRRDRLQRQVMQSLERSHSLATSSAVAAEIVDSTAAMFLCARVSLAQMNTKTAKVLAVSHVDSIDYRGQAYRQLTKRIASLKFQKDSRLTEPEDLKGACEAITSHDDDFDASLSILAATRDREDRLRMFLQVNEESEPDAVTLAAIDQWSRQSLPILADRLRFESIPLAKVYLAVAPQALTVSPTRTRRLLTLMGGIIFVVTVALIPTSMSVTVPATLRPDGTRMHYAPSDAVIQSVEVKHGQAVDKGDVLLRLRDWAIEEQMTTLLARRGVISQRLQRSISLLVEVPSSHVYPKDERASTSDEELVQQQRLLEEEIAGLDEQIELLQAAHDRLTIVADRAGTVDAWKTELTATGRPVRRGEALIRVEPAEAIWVADAQVQQSRVGLVMDQFQQHPETTAKIATLARPDRIVLATFKRRSIAFDAAGNVVDGVPSAASLGIELTIKSSGVSDNVEFDDQTWTYGAPATVTIDCGKRPLAYVFFYDLLRAITRTWSRWI